MAVTKRLILVSSESQEEEKEDEIEKSVHKNHESKFSKFLKPRLKKIGEPQ